MNKRLFKGWLRVATLKEIADKAGVSISVASRALSRMPDKNARVSQKTRDFIRALAKQLGYRHNRAAEFLKRGAAPVIGIFLPHKRDSLMADMAMGFAEAANEAGFPISLSFGSDYESYKRFVQSTSIGRHCGIITYPYFNLKPEIGAIIEHFRAKDGKLIVLETREVVPGVPSVFVDDRLGGQLAAERLLARGCKRFLTLGIYRARMDGFRDALAAAGKRCECVYEEDATAVAQVRQLCRSGLRLGVFAATDYLALRVMAALSGTKYRVGEEVLLIGYDNQSLTSDTNPPLTTVHQPWREVAVRAVQKMVNLVYGGTEQSESLSPTLIIRGTA